MIKLFIRFWLAILTLFHKHSADKWWVLNQAGKLECMFCAEEKK